jgi:GT2 family glycosyltransferase
VEAYPAMSASLSVSIVSYGREFDMLAETLQTLGAAIRYAKAERSLGETWVHLVDNGPGSNNAGPLRALTPALAYEVISGHGNIGYGRGHNLALCSSVAEFHLVLNPDVALAPAAIDEALRYMTANPGVAILAPLARDQSGRSLYLCKRYPSVLDLVLRGFAPQLVKRLFRSRLERYEMRDLPPDRPSTGIPIVSGSFMFCRRAPVAEIGGFSDAFFLYFEDFDLSLRAAARGDLAWVPYVQIVHHGGYAARKGWRHVGRFACSAITFFNRHGWKWA